MEIHEITEEDRWYLNRYLSMSEELKQAYELKEVFQQRFNQAKENGPEEILQAKETLYAFYERVKQVDIPEFNKAIKTLQNWQVEILNSFVYNYSNGFLEGINNLTKVINGTHLVFEISCDSALKFYQHKFKKIGNHVG